jgi:hypothetical protein
MVPLPPSSSSIVFTQSKRYRLYQQHAYRPGTTIFSKSRPTPLSFEQIKKADALRYALATVVLSFGNIKRLTTSFFGLLPENSLLDKCPYYRKASLETAPNLPQELKWVTRVQNSGALRRTSKIGTELSSGLSGYRKKYRRDNFTLPGMVALYNTALVWMMFNIEVRASSL